MTGQEAAKILSDKGVTCRTWVNLNFFPTFVGDFLFEETQKLYKEYPVEQKENILGRKFNPSLQYRYAQLAYHFGIVSLPRMATEGLVIKSIHAGMIFFDNKAFCSNQDGFADDTLYYWEPFIDAGFISKEKVLEVLREEFKKYVDKIEFDIKRLNEFS